MQIFINLFNATTITTITTIIKFTRILNFRGASVVRSYFSLVHNNNTSASAPHAGLDKKNLVRYAPLGLATSSFGATAKYGTVNFTRLPNKQILASSPLLACAEQMLVGLQKGRGVSVLNREFGNSISYSTTTTSLVPQLAGSTLLPKLKVKFAFRLSNLNSIYNSNSPIFKELLETLLNNSFNETTQLKIEKFLQILKINIYKPKGLTIPPIIYKHNLKIILRPKYIPLILFSAAQLKHEKNLDNNDIGKDKAKAIAIVVDKEIKVNSVNFFCAHISAEGRISAGAVQPTG